MNFFLPTIIPACAPPSILSPENVTTSTPSSKLSITVGSFSNPYLLKSIKTPLPMSSITGISFSLAKLHISLALTLLVKPTILKFEL